MSTIVRLENDEVNPRTGKVDVPRPSTLRKLAEALGDGDPDRTRDAQHQLFVAAGYGEEVETPDDADQGEALATLRARVEAHERQIETLTQHVRASGARSAQLQRLLEALPPDQQEEAIRLLTTTLERFAQSGGQ